ncbi:MAG TPA: glucose-1-phosphate cytidylyltransferase [Gemmataceae bacterium]|nr:glucose-1-phosphate cytidylyltransferase [Gemmataceae bacterium]
MQVVILCGGQGTRIRDIADDIPKPMIPIGTRPIVWHIMKIYAQHGYTDFILCLGHKSWTIKSFILNYHLTDADFSVTLGSSPAIEVHGPDHTDNWKVTLVETGAQAMTGRRLKRVEKYLTGDTFLLTYGDGVADVDIGKLLSFHHEHGRIGTVTAVRPPGRFGEIDLNGPQVVGFNEKPLASRGWISGGFFVFQRSFLDRLSDDENLVLEQEPLAELARDGQLMAYRHNGFWHPMDNSRDYHYLNKIWAEGKAAWCTWEPQRLRLAA